jgi:excisionase family DNA binding protein
MPNRTSQPSKAWLSGVGAAAALGVSLSTLRRIADAGHIRTFRTLGGHRRYSADDLTAIQSGEKRIDTPPAGPAKASA